MLILTRKPGESVYIGDNVKITIVEIKGHQIRVGIDAPRELRIYREEIYEQILEENRQAAAGLSESSDADLDTLSAAWGKKHTSKGPSKKLAGLKVNKGHSKKVADNDSGDGDDNDSGGVRSDRKDRTPKRPEVIKRRKKRDES